MYNDLENVIWSQEERWFSLGSFSGMKMIESYIVDVVIHFDARKYDLGVTMILESNFVVVHISEWKKAGGGVVGFEPGSDSYPFRLYTYASVARSGH